MLIQIYYLLKCSKKGDRKIPTHYNFHANNIYFHMLQCCIRFFLPVLT